LLFVEPFFVHSGLELQGDVDDDLESQNEDDRPSPSTIRDSVATETGNIHKREPFIKFILSNIFIFHSMVSSTKGYARLAL
jgi:hypothetical protein